MKSISTPTASRYDALDLWRGVACLCVVLCHSVMLQIDSGQHTTGVVSAIIDFLGDLWIGVPLFFVISGYCIAAAVDRASARQHSAVSFFVRRFRRIYPPLWIATACGIILFAVFDVALFPGILSSGAKPQFRPWWFSTSQWIGNLTLTELWRPYLFGRPKGLFLQQAWTLCYEEQFYAVSGLLLLTSRRSLFKGAAIASVFTVAAVIVSRETGIQIQGFFFDGNWLMFAAGILVYWACTNDSARARALSTGALLVGVLLSEWAPQRGTALAFGFAALLIWTRSFDRQIVEFKALRPFFNCGKMCYSLYLVHLLIVRAVSAGFIRAGVTSDLGTLLLTVPVCAGASLLAASMFYSTVERRFLNTARPDRKRIDDRPSPIMPVPIPSEQ